MRKKWYILQTFSGMENKVKELIEEKARLFEKEKFFGKILIPEESEIDLTNKKVDRIVVEKDAIIHVKNGDNVKKGDIIAEEPEVIVKRSGVISEIKNFRRIIIETKDRKYLKDYTIPESAKIMGGLKINTPVEIGMPLAAEGGYESAFDGTVVAVEKLKRIVVSTDDHGEDLYYIYKDNFDSAAFRKGTYVEKGQMLSNKKEFKAKSSGKVEIRDFGSWKQIIILKTRISRLFPGYMFIEMILNKETQEMVKNIPYVINFINIGGTPVQLKNKEVKALLRLTGEESYEVKESKIRVDYEVGEHVRIINGPFEFFTGKITEIDLHKQTVKVTINMFGRETDVELGLTEIEKIS
ncbi:transcription antiterminator [Marinitoga piezophila KA3]|uniref:Transcription termination/antitermination protein NusG n=1 Tax=Marinitoga piezophila (strain DSM 14283 / JCM 11233 / KA3) TaxID=443254 RepID=H2J5F6_MARPK|nr:MULTISPECIES: transcription termination/antitermination NusG family protein [Marinitoga]AEX86100.1 transcription antiterminator [Marinitoga piezophila KA3]APT76518.1 antitermination protein NusG [Marinitoga sp. 1137]